MIDTAKQAVKFIGEKLNLENSRGWCFPIIGADKCIYFNQYDGEYLLQFNPCSQNTSLIGTSYADEKCGSLASDGFIYYSPYRARSILQVDTRALNDKVLELVLKREM